MLVLEGEPRPRGMGQSPGRGQSPARDRSTGRNPDDHVAQAPEATATAVPYQPESARHEGTRFTGVARSVHRRRADQETILELRIERYDARGDRLGLVPVQLRGYGLIGTVTDGDQVEVDGGKWRKGTLRATVLRNLTTGAEVRVRTHRALRIGCLIVFIIIFLAILIPALYALVVHGIMGQPG